MKIVTYSNKNTHGYLRYLDSCKKNKIIPINLAKKNEKFSFVLRLKYMIDFLKITPPKEIIYFTDSWDVIFLDNLENIKKKFISMNIPYLFSAEENFMCVSNEYNIKKKWPYKKHFLNLGGYIGYNDELLKIFNEIDKHDYYNIPNCDQSVLYNYFYYNPEKLIIDYNRKIFATYFRKTNLISNIFLNFCFYKSNYVIKNKNLFYKDNNNKISILHYAGKKSFFLNYMAYIKSYYNTFILEISVELFINFIVLTIVRYFYSNIFFILFIVVNSFLKEHFTRPIRHYIKYYKRKLIES